MTRISDWMVLGLLVVVAGSGLSMGCAAQCPQVRDQYRQALEQETRIDQAQTTGDEPAQLGVSVRSGLIEDLANGAVQATIKAGLAAVSSLDVGGGQSVDVRTRGDVIDLQIEASDACQHCFRVGGRLDGRVDISAPLVGDQSTGLDGSLSLVAPLKLVRAKAGGGVLQLDLSQAARIGKTSLDARLSSTQNAVARAVQSELSNLLLDELTDKLDAVDLLAFSSPDFGIPGLEVFPVELASDARSDTIFAGFSTNIAALAGQPAIEAVTDLEDDQNIAIAFNPNLVVHGVGLMMQKDVVSRAYDSDGRPLRGGPARATVEGFSFSKGRVGELPMNLDFRVFNVPQDGSMCYWFSGRAAGRVALKGQNLEVSLTDVDITDSSLPSVAVKATDWLQADFLQGGKRLVRASLDDENIDVPGGKLQFMGLSIELADNAVVLKGRSALDDR
jgi:hypothetical protein